MYNYVFKKNKEIKCCHRIAEHGHSDQVIILLKTALIKGMYSIYTNIFFLLAYKKLFFVNIKICI